MIVKIAVPVLLLTASAVCMTPDDCACLRAFFFRGNYFLMICVLPQMNVGRLMAREAVVAPTLAARRIWAVGAVTCFLELVLKLYIILVLCPAAVVDTA